MKGIAICEKFYNEVVKDMIMPIFPEHGAALLGGGSEVLGFDDMMSRDHNWYPRCIIFMDGAEASLIEKAKKYFHDNLQSKFEGFETRLDIYCAKDYFEDHLGFDVYKINDIDWLTIPTQLLCELTKGAVFKESETLTQLRGKLKFYPHDIQLYILASQWERIGQEMAFMGRCGDSGDNIGSALLCSRLFTYIMRLCFLYEKQYAPYWKWFGRAFSKLKCAKKMEPLIEAGLKADNWKDREKYLSQAYIMLGKIHNESGLTPAIPPEVVPYYTRPFMVAKVSEYQEALLSAINDKNIRALPKGIGAVDQISDQTDFLGHKEIRLIQRNIYTS